MIMYKITFNGKKSTAFDFYYKYAAYILFIIIIIIIIVVIFITTTIFLHILDFEWELL